MHKRKSSKTWELGKFVVKMMFEILNPMLLILINLMAVETNRRGSKDDLLVLFIGRTTARAEQGGDMGNEMEVGDGSVQGHLLSMPAA